MTPPHEFIAEELSARGWTHLDIAERSGCSVVLAKALCTGKRRITRVGAVLLANAFGTSSDLWLGLQKQWDEQA